MYELLVRRAADLWGGTDPAEVRIANEYLRGQVELILALGVHHPYMGLDHDEAKWSVARDIRQHVV